MSWNKDTDFDKALQDNNIIDRIEFVYPIKNGIEDRKLVSICSRVSVLFTELYLIIAS